MNSSLPSLSLKRFFQYLKYISVLKSLLIFLLVILIFTNIALGQKSVWRYVTTVSGGTKVYLNDEIKNLAGGNKTAWEKMVMLDGTYTIALAEWDCSNKRRLTKQLSLYNLDQTVAQTIKKKNEWSEIIPDSTSDFMFSRLCLPPSPEKWAQIISEKANLRSLPIITASVIRTASQGDKFYMVPETGKGGWYNIVDIATQEDFWIHGNDFKIISKLKDPTGTRKTNFPEKVRKRN